MRDFPSNTELWTTVDDIVPDSTLPNGLNLGLPPQWGATGGPGSTLTVGIGGVLWSIGLNIPPSPSRPLPDPPAVVQFDTGTFGTPDD